MLKEVKNRFGKFYFRMFLFTDDRKLFKLTLVPKISCPECGMKHVANEKFCFHWQ